MNFEYYFRSLEKRFLKISNYIEVTEDNFSTYSREIELTILDGCAAFEYLIKELCELIQPGFKDRRRIDINDIADVLDEQSSGSFFSDFIKETITLTDFEIVSEPFIKWKRGSSPTWWKAYNGIKHRRVECFKEANLKNLIDTLSAVELVNFYITWKEKCSNKRKSAVPIHRKYKPEIFRVTGVYYDGPSSTDDVFDI